MSFREKLAWAMSAVLILTGGFYALQVIQQAQALGTTPPPSIGLLIAYVVLVVIGSIIGATGVALSNTEEANAPADERERIIADRAGNWSGWILGFAAISGVLHYWMYEDGRLMFHLVVGGLMVSQIAEYVFEIILHRRSV